MYIVRKYSRRLRLRSKDVDAPACRPSPRETDDVPPECEFPTWPPPNPQEILRDRGSYAERFINRKYHAPKGVFHDQPLFSLYRLYEWIMVGHTVNMRNEIELFWWKRWPVSTIPDPRDDDPERSAVLACIPALLAESFNERIDLGLRREEPHSILSLEEQERFASSPKNYESVPEWTGTVPALKELLHIPQEVGLWQEQPTTLDHPQACQIFRQKNILCPKLHIHFI